MRRFGSVAASLLTLSAAWFALAPGWVELAHTALVGSPRDAGIERYETVEFQPRDQPIALRAWWMPAPDAIAAVIMVHGGGDNRSHPYMQWLRLAAALLEHGYAVMDLDLRNHGESGDSRDARPTFGVTESLDVRATVDYLAQRDAALRFAAIGYSMGGQAVLYAAADDPRLRAVVADSTYADAPCR